MRDTHERHARARLKMVQWRAPMILHRAEEMKRPSLRRISPEQVRATRQRAFLLAGRARQHWHTGRPEVIAPQLLQANWRTTWPLCDQYSSTLHITEYATKEGFALVLDEEDIQKLREWVKKLVLDVECSRQLIENAKRILKNHDATVNAQSILNSFIMARVKVTQHDG